MSGVIRIDRSDPRSRNDVNRGLFWANWELLRLQREWHESRARKLQEAMDEIEHAWMDAQDACWDGVL